MAYPAGFSSDEDDEFGGFISDGSADLEYVRRHNQPIHQDGLQEELVSTQSLSSLFFAIMNGNLQKIITALDQGLDINVDLRDGWTPLMLAASVGNSDIARELIIRGANVNADRDKYTVLMATCSCPESTSPAAKCLDIVTQLIEKGAVVDAITKKRKTAIMFAASNGNVEVVVKLLSFCNINAEDNQGWNALFWAANDNQPLVVQVLLDAGLNPDKVDIRENKAIFYAISQEHEEVIKLLTVQVEDTVTTMQETCYQLETLFEDHKPQFFRDICCMLYGMKCENLVTFFTNVSLLDFLSLNEAKLLELGIVVPYQCNRILTGLHKFHKHTYRQTSIPVVSKSSLYSTIDVSCALISAVRQLIAMEASLKYISASNIDIDKRKCPFHIHVMNIRSKITKLRKTAMRLNVLAKTWDASNQPVDLIRSTRKTRNVWKWFGFTSLLLFTVVTACKVQRY